MKVIGLSPKPAKPGTNQLFDKLAEVFSCQFISDWDKPGSRTPDAVIFLQGNRNDALSLLEKGIPCFIVQQGTTLISEEDNTTISFGSHTQLHPALHNQSLPCSRIDTTLDNTLKSGDTVLANCHGKPVWALIQQDNTDCHICSIVPPELDAEEYLIQVFTSQRYMQLLPIFHFVRTVCNDPDWHPPPLRACLMFDDPNLHWPSYGRINFHRIADSARQVGFHASMATIPLDGWLVHPGVARLFDQQSKYLSLLIHGNNHTKCELAQPAGDTDLVMQMAQAIKRIEHMEDKSGLKISRVMAPPHGACAEPMMRAMLRVGFEGASISHDSVWGINSIGGRPASTGLRIATPMAGIFPVFPRFSIRSDFSWDLVLAAFLDQPMIPFGHHDDLIEDEDICAKIAEKINHQGSVQWMNMRQIARSSYWQKQKGAVLSIKPYSRRIEIPSSKSFSHLYIEPPADWETEELKVKIITRSTSGERFSQQAAFLQEIEIPQAEQIEIRIQTADEMTPGDVPSPPLRFWPVKRRILTELRDRLLR